MTQPHRPPLRDRLMLIAAKAYAKRCLARFLNATRHATAEQSRVLAEKIRRNAAGDFGRSFGFASIRSYADFVRQVPILTYEDHKPYIERVKRGETSAMFGPGQRVLMFAMSSGTANEPKYVPVTQHVLNECRQGWNAFGVKALLDHSEAFLRRIVQIASRMDESRTEAGIPCGAITGLMAATQQRLVRKYYIAPPVISHIDDTLAKYYTVMRLGAPEDVAFSITASPATHLALARTADQHREQIIRDVRDGTLWAELPVDPAIRRELAPRMRPNPEAARRLEQIVRETGALLPKDYWRLSYIGNWTGGTMGLYLRDFPKYFGDAPVRDVGLIASEGRITIPVDDHKPVGILEVNGSFFEFIPRDEKESKKPVVLRSHELEAGGEYFVLLTTSSGLCRYDLNDLVRMHGRYNEAPLLEFLNKGSHISSLTGEKLTEQQAILAMQKAASTLGLHIDTFVLAPRWAETPFYVLHVEPPTTARPEALAALAAEIDTQLAEVNVEYASKRKTGRLGIIRTNTVPAGFLAELDARLRNRHRRGNEQYKHQYLYVTPGADADFPTGNLPDDNSGGYRASPQSQA